MITKEEYAEQTKASFESHERTVNEAFAQLDIVQRMVAEIRLDLDTGPTKKPKISFSISQGYATAQCFIRLKSGSIKVGFEEETLKTFIKTGDLGSSYRGANLDYGIDTLFQDRFNQVTEEVCCVQSVSIDRVAFLWDQVSRERAGEILTDALKMCKLEDVDSTEKQLMHERRILFDRIRRVLEETCGGEYGQEKRPVPSRDVLIETILGSTAPRDPFSIYYRKHINPWGNSDKTKFKYAQVDYELDQEDAEQLADEILVKKVMKA